MKTKLMWVLVACALMVAVGCRPGRVGARCRTTDWGDDGGNYVLQCKKGRWVRVMTKGQAVTILKALADRNTTTTTSPPPPATTTTVPAPSYPDLPAALSAPTAFPALGGGAPNGTDFFVTSASRNGRYLAAEGDSDNLVAGDANAKADVFLRDTVGGTTQLVSVSTAGTQGNDDSFSGYVSDDGRYVVFASYATNLAPGTATSVLRLYRRDLQAGTTSLVGQLPGGGDTQALVLPLSISADGSKIAAWSPSTDLVAGDTNAQPDYFVLDVTGSDTYTRVSVSSVGAQADTLTLTGNDADVEAHITADGTAVVFDSVATTLVPGDTNGKEDVFVRDLGTNTTTRLSVSDSGQQLTDQSVDISVSDDGNRVAFETFSTSPLAAPGPFVGGYVRDRSSGRTIAGAGDISSPNGRYALAGIVRPNISGDGSTLIGVGGWFDGLTKDYAPIAANLGDVSTNLSTGASHWANRIDPRCAGASYLTAGNVITCFDGRRWSVPA